MEKTNILVICKECEEKNMYSPRGIIPALPTPFTPDLKVDENQLKSLVEWISGIEGVTGILVNGHAGDVVVLSREERKKILQIAVRETNGKVPVIAGISGGGTQDTIEYMKDAERVGATAALVLIPTILTFGFNDEQVYNFFKTIAEATSIPIIIYQHPVPNNYSTDVLKKLTEIENVVGIKDTSWNFEVCRKDYKALDEAPRKISKLTGNDLLIFPTFTLNADGAILGFASLLPEKVIELFSAVKEGDLNKAVKINSLIEPLAYIIYGPPSSQNSARLKEGLVMRGKLANAVSRPPLLPVSASEKETIYRYLKNVGLI